MSKLLTYDPHKKKIVNCGEVRGNRLIRHVNSKHFFRIANGYGIQEVAFEKVVEMGLKHISLEVDATGVLWTTKIENWKEHGKVADYGHGKQRFLSLKYMHAKKLKGIEPTKREEIRKAENDENVGMLAVISGLPRDEKNELRKKLGLKPI